MRLLGIALGIHGVDSGLAMATPLPQHAASATSAPEVMPDSLSTQQAARLLAHDPGVVVLDVRTEAEYHAGHLANARLLPITELAHRIDELSALRHKTLLVYCRTQNRSAFAQRWLASQGFKVIYMQGGTSQWQHEGRELLR